MSEVSDPHQVKRSKKEMKSYVNLDDTPSTPTESSSKRDKKSVKDKRKKKAEAKETQQPQSNKGLITSATMLSVVGLLNYMGNTAAQTTCHGGEGQMFIDQGSNDMNPREEFRSARVSDQKQEILEASLTSDKAHEDEESAQQDNEWSIISAAEGSFTVKPTYSDYDFAGEMVPIKPSQILAT